jgi:hypothetical protein
MTLEDLSGLINRAGLFLAPGPQKPPFSFPQRVKNRTDLISK